MNNETCPVLKAFNKKAQAIFPDKIKKFLQITEYISISFTLVLWVKELLFHKLWFDSGSELVKKIHLVFIIIAAFGALALLINWFVKKYISALLLTICPSVSALMTDRIKIPALKEGWLDKLRDRFTSFVYSLENSHLKFEEDEEIVYEDMLKIFLKNVSIKKLLTLSYIMNDVSYLRNVTINKSLRYIKKIKKKFESLRVFIIPESQYYDPITYDPAYMSKLTAIFEDTRKLQMPIKVVLAKDLENKMKDEFPNEYHYEIEKFVNSRDDILIEDIKGEKYHGHRDLCRSMDFRQAIFKKLESNPNNLLLKIFEKSTTFLQSLPYWAPSIQEKKGYHAFLIGDCRSGDKIYAFDWTDVISTIENWEADPFLQIILSNSREAIRKGARLQRLFVLAKISFNEREEIIKRLVKNLIPEGISKETASQTLKLIFYEDIKDELQIKYPSKDSIKGKDFAIILKQGQKREHWCFINLFDGIQVTDDEKKVNELVDFF
ncbi:MAG: hypothetical protein OEW87_14860, partial [Flavobacteriaceae bacterium]|nr:hypothetical protein [Flavobacteriaceae bacterium]